MAWTRGGHCYTCCTDTHDRDQNLIGLIFGPWSLDRLLQIPLIAWLLLKATLIAWFQLEKSLIFWPICSIRRWPPTFCGVRSGTGSKPPVAGVSTASMVVTTPWWITVDGAANAEFVVFFTFQVLGRGKLVAKGSLRTLLISRSLQARLVAWVLEHDRVSLRISVSR